MSTAQRHAREGHIGPELRAQDNGHLQEGPFASSRQRGQLPPRVLVIYDDSEARAFAHRALRGLATVISRTEAIEGLALLEQRRLGVLVLELLLPDIDGVKLLRQLPPAYRPSRVVVVTGWLGAAPIARALGVHEFPAKPCSSDRLRSAVLTASKRSEGDRRA